MTLRRDHAAGLGFILAGVLVLAVSGDLPFGTLASPGAGMLPTLLIALMVTFGLILLARAQNSPALAELDWSDASHAAIVAGMAIAAALAFERAGFVLTSMLALLGLILLVERRRLLPALAFSAIATGIIFMLFSVLLRTPLPRGPFGF